MKYFSLLLGVLCFLSLCAQAEDSSPEIKINAVGVKSRLYDKDDPNLIWGWADLHSHQFSNFGFGGKLFVGAPYGDPEEALRDKTSQHGIAGLKDLIGNYLRSSNPISGHAFSGYKSFKGWPRWDTYDHQTMYYKWLERAFLGGQKLLVIHAVNNEVLCKVHGYIDEYGCNDMAAIARQVAGIRSLQFLIDVEDDGIPNGSGWYQVVTSPAQAREVISSGKMAVVIGVEVDSLFDCKFSRTDSCAQQLDQSLDYLYALGVRHVFPIHVFDNAFGGTAINKTLFNYGNYIINDSFYDVEECEQAGNDYALGKIDVGVKFLGFFVFGEAPAEPDYSAYDHHCNARGLSPVGEQMVEGLMKRGMLIDVDHMSNHMFDRVLEMAQDADYPLIASHTTPLSARKPGHGSEGSRTDAQLRAIRDLGGMIAVNLASKSTSELKQYEENGKAPVPFTCSYSSQSWAQGYLSAVNIMATNAGDELLSVGLGSDFNGFVTAPAPRLGNNDYHLKACGGVDGEVNGTNFVAYPFQPHGAHGNFHRQQNKDRTYDIALDGVAHVGMLPDFIEELKVQGMNDKRLKPLFHSAEKYIQVWEKAVAMGNPEPAEPPAPVNASVRSRGYKSNGWYSSGVFVDLELGDARGDVSIWSDVVGEAPDNFTDTRGAKTSVALNNEGVNVVQYYARDDRSGLLSEVGTTTVKIDKTAPTVELTVGSKPKNGWYNGPVEVTIAGYDAGSGLDKIVYYVNGEKTIENDAPYVTIRVAGEGENEIRAQGYDRAGRLGREVSRIIRIDVTPP